MGRKRIEDKVAACNIIKYQRQYSKIKPKKTITIPIIIDCDTKVGCILTMAYNPRTENISKSHSLKCKKAVIYPTVSQKLKCVDQHALDMLEKRRKINREYRKK